MHINDKQPSKLHTVYTPGASGFLYKVFEWLKNELSPRAFFHGNVNGSSFPAISINTIQIKMHNWTVSLVSVDLSTCSEKHLQSAMSLWSYYVKSSAISLQRCVTVLLDRWRALIDDNISGLFLKSTRSQLPQRRPLWSSLHLGRISYA